jgi:hypothetical protein
MSIEAAMAETPKTETPKTAANKASAFRWGIGLVVVLALGVIVWLISDPRGQPIDPTPQHEPGYEDQSGPNQPPAVIPNQDPGTGKPTDTPPATSGAGTQ